MTVAKSALPESEVTWLVTQACRAPSIHNTQPWRFVWDGHGFDVYADTRRGLTVSDPDGRELVISCGAALYNLRVALRHRGLDGDVRLLPDPTQSRLLARVVVEAGDPASRDDRRRFSALVHRHTHRGPFDDRTVPSELEVAFLRAAEAESARLIYVQIPGQRHRVIDLARQAAAQLDDDERARAETEQWTAAPGSARADGVPATAFPPRPAWGADELAGRDFDLGRSFGLEESTSSTPGLVGVLVTEGDAARDWLEAGQALEHILLMGAERWVFAALHSQISENAPLRAELRRELSTPGHPQMLLRFGYAHNAAATPRRPASEVLEVVEPSGVS
jgi:nitroreductase